MNISMLIIWLILIVAFAVIELVTIQLTAIWLAIGAIAGMAACSFGVPVPIQVLTAAFVSLILLIITRPLVKRFLNVKHERTNADRLIGKTAVVTERICNLKLQGAVKVSGVTWTARSDDGSEIEEGEKVTIQKIEGSKLIVSKYSE